MRAFLGLCLVVLVVLGVIGFLRGWFTFTDASRDGKRDLTVTVDQDKIRTDRDQVLAKFHSARDEFRDSTQRELRQLEIKLDVLKQEAGSASGEVRDRLRPAINDLSAKLQSARSEFRELETATQEGYDNLKTRINVKIAEVKEGLEKARAESGI